MRSDANRRHGYPGLAFKNLECKAETLRRAKERNTTVDICKACMEVATKASVLEYAGVAYSLQEEVK